jgi:hypothetical protein
MPPQRLSQLKKGTLLLVKAPPYYTQEYTYEIVGAGDKRVRAILSHSPKVRKSWTTEELLLLMDMGIVRVSAPTGVSGKGGAG